MKVKKYEDELAKELDNLAVGSEDYHDSIKSLESVSKIRQADERLAYEKAKLEFEQNKLYAENYHRSEEAKARRLDSWLKFAGTCVMGAFGFLIARIVEFSKEDGHILKNNEIVQWAMNLVRRG